MLTLAEVTDVSGEEGNFVVSITKHPRYVDVDKCIACGDCAVKCPKKIPDEYDEKLGVRKAIYVKYAQAVPLKYTIDPENCIMLTKGKCGSCAKACPTGAINYDDKPDYIKLNVGAIVLALGSETFDPSSSDSFGYSKYPNIVTSIEFERILSASGPYAGHVVRPSDKKEPEKIAWIQCIGSRDEHLKDDRGYCSSVCCTYAIKEAMLAKEHSHNNLDTAIFYIDLRTNGKDFERYYNNAKNKHGVRFVKSHVVSMPLNPETGGHKVRYVDENGILKEEDFDIIVLSVGLGATKEGKALAESIGIKLDKYGFASTQCFSPVESSIPGIYVCGAFQGPKDIPTSVIDSSAAAGAVGSVLSSARWSLTKTKKNPPETDVNGEVTRIGVFVCRCGSNIASVVDVQAVVDYAKKLPGVVYATDNMFSCSQDTQNKMAQIIKEHKLNRVVVAACTPRSHEPLFQETLVNAGLNKYLFEMANIRNQCSWVHKDDPEGATKKSINLLTMAVRKASLLKPLSEPVLTVNQNAMVIGGGIAGMSAAKNLAEQGYHTFLIEKNDTLGGNALNVHETWCGDNVGEFIKLLESNIRSHSNIKIFCNAEITQVDGFVGNFKTKIKTAGKEEELEHGVTVIASGASELKPEGFLYGKDSRVITGLELQPRLASVAYNAPDTILFLQCAGSRISERPYCSKICCTSTIKSALTLKERNPSAKIFVIHRDMRPYGLREELYRKARGNGISFIRCDSQDSLNITKEEEKITVSFIDSTLRRPFKINPDLIVLASAIVPEKDNPLAKFFKIPQNDDGFFLEAHAKLKPVDFATDGVYVCGLAHSPKPIEESITQGYAAAARAVNLLSAQQISVPGTVATVKSSDCSKCGICVSICPYGAPRLNEKTGGAEIEATLCKGCGLCSASCRSGAITLKGFDNQQIFSMIDAALA